MTDITPLMPEIDFGLAQAPDLHERLDQLRAHGPVVPVTYLGQPVWLILGHAELDKAFNDLENFDPGPGYEIIAAPSMGRTLQTLTGNEHRISRGLVSSCPSGT